MKGILKKVYPWLGEVNSQALQMASRNLDTAYKKFFQRKEAGFPRFKNRKLAKSLCDASFGFFRMRMEQKCRERGKRLVLAHRFYASSKTCNTCKTTERNLPLSVREWICPTCGKLSNLTGTPA
jgi:transposase